MRLSSLKNAGLALVAAAAVTGCYVETMDDRAPTTGGELNKNRVEDPTEAGICRSTIAKGCFDGHVLSKKEFFVEGKQYFNADDFSARFGELIKVEGDGAELAGDDVTLALTTPIDNQSFVQGFEYYYTGERTGSGKVRQNGNFSMNELPEGVYDLRVQRSVKFNLSRTITTPAPVDPNRDPNTPAPQPKTELITKAYCATIYADTTLDVRRAKRQTEMFGDFRLHITDANCEGAHSGTTLTLDK